MAIGREDVTISHVVAATGGAPMTELKTRIDTLEARLAKLGARKARVEARQRASASRREHKDDTRRKILLGAMQQKVTGRTQSASGLDFSPDALAPRR